MHLIDTDYGHIYTICIPASMAADEFDKLFPVMHRFLGLLIRRIVGLQKVACVDIAPPLCVARNIDQGHYNIQTQRKNSAVNNNSSIRTFFQ